MRGKPVIERTLGSVATLFAQYVAGYVGRSVERRGKDAEQAAVFERAESAREQRERAAIAAQLAQSAAKRAAATNAVQIAQLLHERGLAGSEDRAARDVAVAP